MNLVSLIRFNELRFPADPVPMVKLWRWCRKGKLPARKIGGEWFIDLDAFDGFTVGQSIPQRGYPADIPHGVQLVVDCLTKSIT